MKTCGNGLVPWQLPFIPSPYQPASSSWFFPTLAYLRDNSEPFSDAAPENFTTTRY